MSTVLLPPSIAVKSVFHDYYLNNSENLYPEYYGYASFNGADVFSSLAKFEVLSANTGKGVHIRCRHNRKYLRKIGEKINVISPDADEPEEDVAKWGCTLFEPREVEAGNTKRVYLFHVQSQEYASAFDLTAGVRIMVLVPAMQPEGVYEIIDQESLVILPRYVALKGANAKYLKVSGNSAPTFSSSDKEISETWFEAFTDGDGRVQIKSFHNNKYLRYLNDGEWIVADSDGDTTDVNTLFTPVKLDATTFALKSLSNGKYCMQHTLGSITDGLNASSNSTGGSSRITLEETVRTRRIYNTNFDLANAIIYGESPISMANASASNGTSEASTVQFKLTYKESVSSTWTSSHSWMVGVSVTASFKVPFIGGTDVTASAEYNDSYEWGETVTTENTLETTYTATVPPYSSITVRLMATEGNCDVRYSYYQRDLLYSGDTVIFQKDDGLCTGVNSYNFYYDVTTVKNMEPGVDLSDASVDTYPTVVKKIPLPQLSRPTTVQTPVTSTASPKQELLMSEEEFLLAIATIRAKVIQEEGGETVA